jgi:competence protein ComEA
MKRFAFFVVPAALSFMMADAQERLPAGPGRDTLKKVCSMCHSPENVVGMAKNRDDWGAVVGQMASTGADGTDDEFNQIVDYLAAYFPKSINVNKAAAKDLEAGLQLSSKEAESMVRYRGENGNFKSIEDIQKVPGLDAAKIAAKKNLLEF